MNLPFEILFGTSEPLEVSLYRAKLVEPLLDWILYKSTGLDEQSFEMLAWWDFGRWVEEVVCVWSQRLRRSWRGLSQKMRTGTRLG